MKRLRFGMLARRSAKNQSPKNSSFLCLMLWLLFALIAAPCIRAGTLRDDFEDGKLEGWRQDSPSEKKPTLWKIIDGELECTRRDSISTVLITGEISWKNFIIEYDVKLLEYLGPGDVDLILRYVHFGNLLLFGVGDFRGASEVFVQAVPANPEGMGIPFEPLKLNEWHHLKAEVKGNDFTFWVNGQKVLDYRDDTLKSGAVGIGLANYKARFDNVVISGPDVPNVTPKTWYFPVQARDKLAATWGQIKQGR